MSTLDSQIVYRVMKIEASVDLECEAKTVDECQTGMSLFTLCQC